MMCVHSWELSMNVWVCYVEGAPHLKILKRGCFLLLVSHLFLGALLVDHHILATGVALPWVLVGAKGRLEGHCYNHCS